MKLSARLILLFIFLTLSLVIASHVSLASCSGSICWEIKNPIPTALYGFGIAINSSGDIYLAGGENSSGHSNFLFAYNTLSNSWTTKRNLPVGSYSMGFTFNPVNEKFYMGGGWTNTGYINNFYEYTPNTNIWVEKAPMKSTRAFFGLVANDHGEIYSIGGETFSQNVNSVDRYNVDTNSWTSVSTIPVSTSAPSVVLKNSKIYVIGGHGPPPSSTPLSNVQIYDLISNTWSTGSPMPTARSSSAVTVTPEGNINIIGGISSSTSTYPFVISNAIEEYNPNTNTWTPKGNFPISGYGLGGELAKNGNIYIFGGITSDGTLLDTNYSGTYNLNDDLDVPILKQIWDPWQSQIYDNANKWNPSSPTIGSWGCALTSAAMVFKYYGYNKLPDGASLNPGTLNIWIKNQKDGYIGQGLINWLALSRLSKISKAINHLDYDALEYKRQNGDASNLTTNINNRIPGILKEPGHYVVAKGINGDTFNINDPYYDRTTLSDGYNNTFENLGSFTKSDTDLSYIMLTINPNINITIKNSSNESIGESFVDGSMSNPKNLNQTNSSLKIYYIPKPPDGAYDITLSSSSNTPYSLGIYMYDINGNVNVQNLSGNLKQGEQFRSKINYKKILISDLNSLFLNGDIDNEGILNSLFAKINSSNNFFYNFLNELNAQREKHISNVAYELLLTDLGL